MNSTSKATHISQLTKEQQQIALKYKTPVQPGAISDFYKRFKMVKEMQELHKFVPFAGSKVVPGESFTYNAYNFMSTTMQYCIPAKFFEKEKVQVEVWLLLDTMDSLNYECAFPIRINAGNRKVWEREIAEGRHKLLNKTFIEVEDNR